MTNASLLITILAKVNETFANRIEIPGYNPATGIEGLAQEVSYRRGVKDVLKCLQEACEEAQGHALKLPEAPEETQAEPERLSADQYLLNDVRQTPQT